MAHPQNQISAFVSADTRVLLEQYAEAHGVKKAWLIEMALLHHLQALKELPADVIIPPRLVLSRASAERVLQRLAEPQAPTAAMQSLFADEGGDARR
jgi:uncharacterized protein (DUF1778 family)